jgi:hypothetical protein
MFLAHLYVFNAETKFSIFVESRFIRDTHTDLKFGVVSTTYALRAFVNIQVGPNSMASAMFEI